MRSDSHTYEFVILPEYLYSQVHRAFLKGILGFCVQAILTPDRWGRPKCMAKLLVKGLGLSRAIYIFCQELTGKQQRAFPHSGFQTSTFTHWLLFFPADYDISLKLKLKHFKGKVHVFQNVASSVSLIQNVGLWMNQFYDMIFGVPAAKVNLFLKLGLRIPEMLTSPQIGVVQWLCLNYLSHSFHVFE